RGRATDIRVAQRRLRRFTRRWTQMGLYKGSVGRLGRESGEVGVGLRAPRCSASVAAPPTRLFPGVPPPHNLGRGPGGEANARASDWLLHRSTRARKAPRNSGGNAVHNNCSIPARIDTLSPTRTHLRPSA